MVGQRTSIIGGSAQMSGIPEDELMPVWLAVLLWTGQEIASTVGRTLARCRREIA